MGALLSYAIRHRQKRTQAHDGSAELETSVDFARDHHNVCSDAVQGLKIMPNVRPVERLEAPRAPGRRAIWTSASY